MTQPPPEQAPTQPPENPGGDQVETARRYWVGVVILVLAILLIIGFALVTFVASDPSTSKDEDSFVRYERFGNTIRTV